MSRRLLSGEDDMDTDNWVPEEVDEMTAAVMDMARGLFIAAAALDGGNECKLPSDVERTLRRSETS